uniref:Uncharacterized protein n=1 Tax=Rhizophora mucronata TaxID=61149 RepID=A0A2P2PEQ4_RHIMU
MSICSSLFQTYLQ